MPPDAVGRVWLLWRSAPSLTTPLGTWRVALRYLGMPRKLGVELVISWKYGRESYRLEAETMAAYLNAFGELLWLNYKANWLLRAERGEVKADA